MRLIDADRLEYILSSRRDELKGCYGDLGGACSGALMLLKMMPTEQYMQKRGKWIECVENCDENGFPRVITQCSQCGKINPATTYCPNCGSLNNLTKCRHFNEVL